MCCKYYITTVSRCYHQKFYKSTCQFAIIFYHVVAGRTLLSHLTEVNLPSASLAAASKLPVATCRISDVPAEPVDTFYVITPMTGGRVCQCDRRHSSQRCTLCDYTSSIRSARRTDDLSDRRKNYIRL